MFVALNFGRLAGIGKYMYVVLCVVELVIFCCQFGIGPKRFCVEMDQFVNLVS